MMLLGAAALPGRGGDPYPEQTWVTPLVAGTRGYAYAITEEGAGSDVDAIEATGGVTPADLVAD